ncbi:MAG: SH3 domain-containing protein [Cyanobacteria bacterium P01_H01_bin.58]
MNLFLFGKRIAIACIGILLSMVGIKSVSAQTPGGNASAAQPQPTTAVMAQAEPLVCTYEWQEPQSYARVVTQEDPLRVRATPGGEAIGAIPKDWAVVVLEVDETGEWTKVTSHFGYTGYVGFFGSAPYFQEGWVASRFLKAIGEFCEKPPLEISAISQLSGHSAQPYTLQEDWLQIGDRIAQNHRQS